MFDLYHFTTGNVFKVALALEEMDLSYRKITVDISKGDQLRPEFLRINPNNKVPALVDHAPADGGPPLSLFESGAILIYLAEKTGQFLPTAGRERAEVMKWLMWQMSGFGPMIGQLHYFLFFAPQPIPHAIERYRTEAWRLYRVMNEQLEGRDYIAGAYSIADMACWGWAIYHDIHGQDFSATPNIARWFSAIEQRPAAQRALDGFRPVRPQITDEARRVMFLQK